MKPSVGRWVHWNAGRDGGLNEVAVYAALIVDVCSRADHEFARASENDFLVTLEVHATTSVRDPMTGPRTVPDVYIVENAVYSPARSGHETARERWTWPPRES